MTVLLGTRLLQAWQSRQSLMSNAGAKARRSALGRSTGGLANLFVHPNSANMIAIIAERVVETVLMHALLRQALQTPGATSQR